MFGPIDSLLVLRDISDGAETTDGANLETEVSFVAARAGDFKAVFHVSALDTTSDETYVLGIDVDSAEAFNSPVTVGSLTIDAPGVYEIPLSADHIEAAEPGTIAIRCKATLGGTTPSITYGAYLTHGG